ncbi:MAG: sel1 repeat family protein [Bacilli bacterium]|jgi:TPR repeat protein|nr:sel1 repeat family protein [Bacilli bacterium]
MEEAVPFETDASVVDPALVKAATMGFPSAEWAVGDALYKAKIYGQAFYWIERAAKHGMKEALNPLGYMCLRGLGTLSDDRKAFHYFVMSAHEGDGNAMMNLSLLYFRGRGCRKDFKKAFRWIVRSIGAGCRQANRVAAYFCLYGIGTEKNEARAFAYLEKGASQGDVRALTKMAECRERGIGVPPDREKARGLFHEAAAKGDPHAEYWLGILCLNREEPHRERAIVHLRAGACAGDRAARLAYGELLMKEGGDMMAAYYWLSLAADKGSRKAKSDLACFKDGYTWAQAEEHMRRSLGAPK